MFDDFLSRDGIIEVADQMNRDLYDLNAGCLRVKQLHDRTSGELYFLKLAGKRIEDDAALLNEFVVTVCYRELWSHLIDQMDWFGLESTRDYFVTLQEVENMMKTAVVEVEETLVKEETLSC